MYYIEERDRDIEMLAQSILELTEQLEEQKKLLKELFDKVVDTSKNSSNDEKADKQDVNLLSLAVDGVKIDMGELAEVVNSMNDITMRAERTIPILNNKVSILESEVNQFGGDIGTLKANQANVVHTMRKNGLL